MPLLRRRPSAVGRWWRSAPVDARVRAVVLAVVLAAAGTALLAATSLRSPDLGTSALVVALLLLLGGFPLLTLRVGGSAISVAWTEAAVLIGLVVLDPALLVVLAGPLTTAGLLLQGRPPQRALYNGAADTLSVALAALVVVAAPGPLDAWSPDGFAVLALAVVCYGVAGEVLTALALVVSEQVGWRRALRTDLLVRVLVSAGNVGLALLTLLLLEQSPAFLLAVPGFALVLALAYRTSLRARQERDVWRQLEVASRELNRLEEREVLSAALRRARVLFRSDDVELALSATDRSPARTYRLVGSRLVAEPAAADPRCGETRWVELDPSGQERPVTTALSAPLDTPRGRIGALRLVFRGEVTMSPRERQVLLTYAHAVSTTLQNARLHEDVRAEAARHAHEASHDALTGLANRVLLRGEAGRALDRAEGTTALLLLDLDHFKEVNDTLGHHAGDVLLQQVAARLQEAVGGAGLVARLGGDEFAVLLTGLADPAQAEPVAVAVLARLAEPVEYEGLRLPTEASLGIACHPQDADSPEELFRRADVAMYQAKGTRGAWLRYDAERDGTSVQRLALVSELRQALERDEIVVHFQPQRDLRTGAVVSAEALCRWQHPVRGLLAPAEFVGVVEQSGLVRPFTLSVLEKALRACARWNAGGGARVRVGVNLGARSLLDAGLPDDVAALLSATGCRPTDLVLEITETTATSELEVVEEVLARLRHSGVEISVDDFGTGYSSLSFLQRSAVNELKVDQSFVRGMLVNDSDAALVRATVQLAHSLGARAVAEGVEDAAHARALRELGCDVAQGWLYGAAVPVEQLQAQLRAARVVRLPAPRVVQLHG